jgi:hypothetical protein
LVCGIAISPKICEEVDELGGEPLDIAQFCDGRPVVLR